MASPGDNYGVDVKDSAYDNQAPPAEDAGPVLDPKDNFSPPVLTSTVESKNGPHDSIHSDTASYPRLSIDETSTNEAPEPKSKEGIGRIAIRQDGLTTNAETTDDGRVHININQTSRKLSQLLHHLAPSVHHEGPKEPSSSAGLPPPRMNVVIQVVGSRGDVQPFVALGKTLKERYHHRVRLATHATFKGFVESNDLEFFNIGGDPAELMAFMVKNPGLMPGFDSLRRGDVGKRQREIFSILLGCWRSCIEAGDGMDVDLPEDDFGDQLRPFVADAIIANPPSFAHIHCAEKLGIPLHLMFTMPWSPTHVFPHPLANVQSSNADPSLANLISYSLVEGLTWQGLGHVINHFRRENLRLEPVSLLYAPSLLNRLKIPYTYCWSPALIPKPNDWGQHISISGFYFLSMASSFTPDPDLLNFLNAGSAPVYIGFGSIVVDDPDAMTTMIFEAIKLAGVRALVSKGWGGLGKGDIDVPEDVFMLGNVPHDWLFQRVSCVVHHGGAGTTAAGIALGKPTVVVPFFGDQPFWGAMIARAGAGPFPVPYKELTASILARSITEALQPSMKEQAAKLAASIAQEKGTEDGARSFHSQLDADSIRCSLAPNRTAVWRIRRTQVRLSTLAATILINEGLLGLDDLKLYRPTEYNTQSEPAGPGAGVAIGFVGAIGDLMVGVTDMSVESVKAVKAKGAARQQDQKRLKSPTSTQQPSRTLTPATTISSSASTLLPENSDLQNTIVTAQTTSSFGSDEGLATPGSNDSDAAKLNATETQNSAPESYSASNEVSRLSLATDRSSKFSRSASEASTLTSPGTHAPIGSQKMEVGPAKVAGRFLGGVVRSPLDLTMTLAQGFHNLPRTWGDHTVRQPDKITDLQSGVKMAGKEFGYGFYDGITGLVTQPIDGAKSQGALGFVKGMGKGFVGAVSKPVAAILGVPAYTYKGIYKELRKSRGIPLQEFIIAARTADGLEDWTASTAQEREQIITSWHEIQPELKKAPSHRSKHPTENTPSSSAA